MAQPTPAEFREQFTPISPDQIYGNVETGKPRNEYRSLDDIHPKNGGHRTPLSLPGWDDLWAGRLQQFTHLSPDVLRAVFKNDDRIVLALDRLLPQGTPQVIGYSELEYDKKLKGYLNFESQDQIRKDLSKGLSVFIVASPDKADCPVLHYIGAFLKGVQN